MVAKVHKELDAPEAQNVAATLIVGFFIFFSGTFMITLLGIGMEENRLFLSWIDIGFHLLCLVVIVPLMREFLSLSWMTVGSDQKTAISRSVLIGIIVLVYATMLPQIPLPEALEPYRWCSESAMPLLTHDLNNTSAYFVQLNPVFGTICAVLVAPLVTCCLFYATAFAKGYNVRPWLGYVLLAAATLFVPIATGIFGWWIPEQQFAMWAVRMPVHLLYCKLYADTDNIWMPILTQAVVNLIACLIVIFLW